MNTALIQKERIESLNSDPKNMQGKYVVYWMQQSQRVRYNHALAYAIELANKHNLPLITVFGLTANFPEANVRHYDFMLRGLADVEISLKKIGIPFVVQFGAPDDVALRCSRGAAAVVVDRGYLRIQKKWREDAALKFDCALIQVESDVVVPVDTVSRKEEYAAATIRPKINKLLAKFMVPLNLPILKKKNFDHSFKTISLSYIKTILKRLKVDSSVAPVEWLVAGETAAQKTLQEFIKSRLSLFSTKRNDPSVDMLSNLSPYLHYGQISPLDIALAVSKIKSESVDSFLEELIVRRELAMNFVHQNGDYDNYYSLPAWAKGTLFQHAKDKREYIYSREQLESGQTHDIYWNAAQREMAVRGKMHGYMRMYWGKKILEWSKSPEEAYETALYLNNKYELDGRDPNGFAGVAWCFGKHDRPWKERPIFGMVRYMNSSGLERKFCMEGYLKSNTAV
ncbi:MAG: deoxyribodipyrimidine photo-lyase [Fibrobacteres bacterium]|nr:deoxyribodipyrimidine photo-lyase [Fibrobacterota bacterium]